MANIIRIKRRGSGAAGAPGSLKNAELAFNEVDNTLYYGRGIDANGNATEVIPIGGNGYVTSLVSGVSSTLNSSITALRSETVTASGTLYGAITAEADARSSAITGLRSEVSTTSASLLSSITSLRSEVQTATGDLLDTINENLSTVLGANVNELATNLNSIKELADSLSGDAAFFTTVNNKLTALSSAIGGEGGSSSRLNTLETAFQTLTASGVSALGTIASQDADEVDITGGTISGVSLTATGTAEFNGIHASGSVTIDSGLTVTSGAANLSGALNVTGNSTLGGTLTVEGATTINDSLSVTGTATFDGHLTATTGTATFGHVNLTSLSGLSAYDFELFNCVLDSGTF